MSEIRLIKIINSVSKFWKNTFINNVVFLVDITGVDEIPVDEIPVYETGLNELCIIDSLMIQ